MNDIQINYNGVALLLSEGYLEFWCIVLIGFLAASN